MNLNQWLSEQPFTLSMSSGFFGFFAHAGMLTALVESGLVPAKITGSSAGALIGGCYASGCSTGELKMQLFELQRSDFWDPGFAFGLLKGGLLKGELFQKKLDQICKVSRFEDCPIPFKVSAFNLASRDTDVIGTGHLHKAIAASCAFPFLFQPVKTHGSYYLDGGIKDRPGMLGTDEGERILYHHIGSRSPWRGKNSPGLKLPVKENMQSISINHLPRVSPNTLEVGKHAFDQAHQETINLLGQRVMKA